MYSAEKWRHEDVSENMFLSVENMLFSTRLENMLFSTELKSCRHVNTFRIDMHSAEKWRHECVSENMLFSVENMLFSTEFKSCRDVNIFHIDMYSAEKWRHEYVSENMLYLTCVTCVCRSVCVRVCLDESIRMVHSGALSWMYHDTNPPSVAYRCLSYVTEWSHIYKEYNHIYTELIRIYAQFINVL